MRLLVMSKQSWDKQHQQHLRLQPLRRQGQLLRQRLQQEQLLRQRSNRPWALVLVLTVVPAVASAVEATNE